MNDYVLDESLGAYHLCMSFGDIGFGYLSFASWLVMALNLDYPVHKVNMMARSVVAEGREYKSSSLVFMIPTSQVVSTPLKGRPGCLAQQVFNAHPCVYNSFSISVVMLRI